MRILVLHCSLSLQSNFLDIHCNKYWTCKHHFKFKKSSVQTAPKYNVFCGFLFFARMQGRLLELFPCGVGSSCSRIHHTLKMW
jgi:hypothetical protein